MAEITFLLEGLKRFVGDLRWINYDDPEANHNMIEGLKIGYLGYSQDNIIRPRNPRLMPSPPIPLMLQPGTWWQVTQDGYIPAGQLNGEHRLNAQEIGEIIRHVASLDLFSRE